MTKARRRVARLALQLHVACTEPVFTGSTYFEQEAGLRQQWSELTPSRRKAARRQALRQISEAGGLERAVEQWVLYLIGDHRGPASRLSLRGSRLVVQVRGEFEDQPRLSRWIVTDRTQVAVSQNQTKPVARS